MSATTSWIMELQEAGLMDMSGNRLSPSLYRAGDRQPVQGANGDRVNPCDVQGEERFQERKAMKMDTMPVAFWFRGDARWQHPGWAYCYNEVAENNGEFRATTKKDGKAIQKWLVSKGYRKLHSWKGSGEITTFRECWMHERYAGTADNPDRFQPKSTAELREYIALAVAPVVEETVAPAMVDMPTPQPESNFERNVDVLANCIGDIITAQVLAGWLA